MKIFFTFLSLFLFIDVSAATSLESSWQSALGFVDFTFLISFIILMSLVYAFVNYKEKYDEY